MCPKAVRKELLCVTYIEYICVWGKYKEIAIENELLTTRAQVWLINEEEGLGDVCTIERMKENGSETS